MQIKGFRTLTVRDITATLPNRVKSLNGAVNASRIILPRETIVAPSLPLLINRERETLRQSGSMLRL